MKIEEAIKELKRYNDWRMGGEDKMMSPKHLSDVIETVIDYFKPVEPSCKKPIEYCVCHKHKYRGVYREQSGSFVCMSCFKDVRL